MAKFEVILVRHIERTETYHIKVRKADVVEALGLVSEDARDWKDHVQTYIEENTAILDDETPVATDDADDGTVEIDSVNEL